MKYAGPMQCMCVAWLPVPKQLYLKQDWCACLFVIMSGSELMHVCLILLFVACAKVTVVLSVCTIQMSVCSTN